jgi:hypothetical protein
LLIRDRFIEPNVQYTTEQLRTKFENKFYSLKYKGVDEHEGEVEEHFAREELIEGVDEYEPAEEEEEIVREDVREEPVRERMEKEKEMEKEEDEEKEEEEPSLASLTELSNPISPVFLIFIFVDVVSIPLNLFVFASVSVLN